MVTHDLDLAAQMDTIVYMRGGVETPTVMNNEQFMSHLEELRGSLLKESEEDDSENADGPTNDNAKDTESELLEDE